MTGYDPYFRFWINGTNAVTPIPTWPTDFPPDVPVSTHPPTSETDYGAIDFRLWKYIGDEFYIKSPITNGYQCREGGGKLAYGEIVESKQFKRLCLQKLM